MRQRLRALASKQKLTSLIGFAIIICVTLLFILFGSSPEYPKSDNHVLGLRAIDNTNNYVIPFDMRGSVQNHPRPFISQRDSKSGGMIFDQSVPRDNTSPVHFATQLSDVLISVKTTGSLHSKRVDLILRTWFQQCSNQSFFFTDVFDEEYQKRTNGHMINTNCSSAHNKDGLCCKMNVEFDFFIQSNKKWFCHFDDDTYVNIDLLMGMLQNYRHNQDWYLGKPSLSTKLQISSFEKKGGTMSFWFATGGAGVCISRSLALKMIPYIGSGKLKQLCQKSRVPDDCTIGLVISHYLNKDLTMISELHSHLEGMAFINENNLDKQITLSYSTNSLGKSNIVRVPGFNITYDPTRFLSVHCALHPELDMCQELLRSNTPGSS